MSLLYRLLFGICPGLCLIFLSFPAAAQNNLVLQNPATAAAAAENQDIHDIFGPVPLPDPVNWPLYAAAAAAAAALLVLGLFLLRRRGKKDAAAAVAPHLAALAELARARDYLESGRSLHYAQKVSDILRNYIEERFTIQSTRQTTSEFLISIRAGKGDAPARLLPFEDSLAHCLNQCDLAKYACKTADREHLEEMERSIRIFIENTSAEEQ